MILELKGKEWCRKERKDVCGEEGKNKRNPTESLLIAKGKYDTNVLNKESRGKVKQNVW